jgi:hypothetical protein
MGQDPTYLVRNNKIFLQLYQRGWSAVVDASKQFHSFPTRPEENHYTGCIYLITGTKLVYVVFLWELPIPWPVLAKSTMGPFVNCVLNPLGFTE